jgi:hypothetical protein
MTKVFALALLLAGGSLAGPGFGQGAHASRQPAGGLLFHYGLVPAEVVLAHPQTHAERQMHGEPGRRESHIVLALFDAGTQTRLAQADVNVHVTLAGGPSVTRRLEPMTIAGQPGFGGFVSIGAPGIYKIRFDVRRPGTPGVASAEFEHRVSPESRR